MRDEHLRQPTLRLTKAQKNISELLGIDIVRPTDDFWSANRRLEKKTVNPTVSRKSLGRTDKKIRRIIVG
ncbi:MAG: hypothetical protein P4L79_10505 [Legionella sp.]|uniref:hypothetical protein n=1 Tax=Legionella sp. TaxID=459 RepID=UPI00283F66BC|nr:hypothetical protein [Legionella sp.]